MSTPRIRSVRASVVRGGGADYHDQEAGALDRRPHRHARWPSTRSTARAGSRSASTCWARWSWRSRPSDGTIGFAVTTGGELGAWIVEKHLARFLEGQPVTDVEKIWDQMYLSTLYYGRKGIVLNTISGVDLALWDLLGQRAAGAGVPPARRRGARRTDLLRDRRASRPRQGAGLHRRQDAAAARPGRGRGGPRAEHREAPDHARTGRRRLLADVRLLDDAWTSSTPPAWHTAPRSTG